MWYFNMRFFSSPQLHGARACPGRRGLSDPGVIDKRGGQIQADQDGVQAVDVLGTTAHQGHGRGGIENCQIAHPAQGLLNSRVGEQVPVRMIQPVTSAEVGHCWLQAYAWPK